MANAQLKLEVIGSCSLDTFYNEIYYIYLECDDGRII